MVSTEKPWKNPFPWVKSEKNNKISRENSVNFRALGLLGDDLSGVGGHRHARVAHDQLSLSCCLKSGI
jgi:hypothetical protein